jgi:hypothetical protein
MTSTCEARDAEGKPLHPAAGSNGIRTLRCTHDRDAPARWVAVAQQGTMGYIVWSVDADTQMIRFPSPDAAGALYAMMASALGGQR